MAQKYYEQIQADYNKLCLLKAPESSLEEILPKIIGEDKYHSDNIVYKVDSSVKTYFNGLKTNGVTLKKNLVLPPVFTKEMWIKPILDNNQHQNLLGGNNKEIYDRPFSLYLKGKAIHGGVSSYDRKTWFRYQTSDVIVENEWQHLAITFDGIWYKIYINGQVVFEKDYMETYNHPNFSSGGDKSLHNQKFSTTPLTCIGTGDCDPYKGYIDELRIWKVARTALQIQEGMYQTFIEEKDDLILSYVAKKRAIPKRLSIKENKILDLFKQSTSLLAEIKAIKNEFQNLTPYKKREELDSVHSKIYTLESISNAFCLARESLISKEQLKKTEQSIQEKDLELSKLKQQLNELQSQAKAAKKEQDALETKLEKMQEKLESSSSINASLSQQIQMAHQEKLQLNANLQQQNNLLQMFLMASNPQYAQLTQQSLPLQHTTVATLPTQLNQNPFTLPKITDKEENHYHN
jgi:hypothetical protein